jgi:hypothetical protein
VQVRSVASHRRRNQRPRAPFASGRTFPEPVACPFGELDGENKQPLGIRFSETSFREAFERRLVAGGGGDIGSRDEVIMMHGFDRFRSFEQNSGGPEGIIEVGASTLELGRERAVENHDPPIIEERGEHVVHGPLS